MILIALDIVFIVPALAMFALAAFLALEVGASFFGPARPPRAASGPVAVIVPAHNEARVIAQTLIGVKSALRPKDRLVVVADNCDDDTAAIARAAGAECLERTDPARRGKGYALQCALDALRADMPSGGVVIIDADCAVSPHAFGVVADVMAATDRPAQMLYVMRAPQHAPARRRVGEFAWLLLNKVRMRGLHRLAGVARFTGAGMALPASLAKAVDLASGEIVEDIALYAQLTAKGAAPVLCEDALVISEFPTADANAHTQRARWERGSLRLAVRAAPALFAAGVRRLDVRAIAAAVDLSIPPLAVFAALQFGVGLAAIIPAFWGSFAPVLISAAGAALYVASVAAAWIVYGRSALPPRDLIALVGYVGDKARIHFGAARRTADQWTRTGRDQE